MPNWIAISLGVVCMALALMQVYMTLAYLGVIPSSVAGSLALVHTSIRSGLTEAVFGLIFFFIAWPQNLFYLAIVLTCRAVIDLMLLWRSVGMFSVYEPGGAFAKARTQMYAQKIGNIVFFAAIVAGLFYYIRPSISNLAHWGNEFNWLPVAILCAAAVAVFLARMLTVWFFTRRPVVPNTIPNFYFLSGVALILITLWGTIRTAWWVLPLGCLSWFIVHIPYRDAMESWSSFQRARLGKDDAA
jgi:hypothetical protein